jgi:hypothetical protein
MSEQSDTPRTDALVADWTRGDGRPYVDRAYQATELARELERELGEAKARIKALDPYGRGVVRVGGEGF